MLNIEIIGRGVGTIFYITAEDKFMFYLRDNKKSILYPNYISLLGGHIDEGETANQAVFREFAEELDDLDTGTPYKPKGLVLFRQYIDDRRVEQNIYGCILNKMPNLRLNEGQHLVFMDREAIKKTDFAFDFKEVINDFIEKL